MRKAYCWLMLVLVCFTQVGWAASVTLAWDASPSADVTWYRIYRGPATRAYTNFVQVPGTQFTVTITNLVEGGTYYFAATAGTDQGLESDFSNEVSYMVPTNRPTLAPPGGMGVAVY